VEKVAQDLAGSVSLEWEAITVRVRQAWEESHALEELVDGARRARSQVEETLAELALPHLPTVPELRERAEELFSESPSLDDIVNRAHELMRRAVAARVLAEAGA
jgi:stearoyl-CoA desaturase (delta-9 desaturase)